MFCSKCGNKLDDGAIFCGVCGNQALETPSANVNKQAHKAHSMSDTYSTSKYDPNQSNDKLGIQKKRNLQWWHILLMVIGSLVIISSVIAGIANNSGDGSNEHSGSNIFQSSSKCPSKERIKSDISAINEVTHDNYNSWVIVDIEEELAQEFEKAYETKVKIKLKNDTYKEAYKTIEMKYDYYDKGGWQLNEYENLSSVFDAVAIKGVNENEAFAFISKDYDGQIKLDDRDTELVQKFDYFSYLVETPGKLWNEQKRVVLKYKINEDTGLWGYPTVEEIGTERVFNKVSGWFYTEIGGGNWDDYNDMVCYRIDNFDGQSATITVCDIAINGMDVQGYNTSIMPDNTIVSDKYVCYKLECSAKFDSDENWYSLQSTNSRGSVIVKLQIDGLALELRNNPKVSYTENLSDIVDVPSAVSVWLK